MSAVGSATASLVKLLSDRFMVVDLGLKKDAQLARAMAQAAQRNFIAARVEVAWFTKRAQGDWSFFSGAAIHGFEATPEATAQEDLSAALTAPRELLPISGKAGHARSARVVGEGGVAFRLRWPEDDHHSVELRILIEELIHVNPDETPPTAAHLAAELSRPVEDILELVFLLRPLQHLARRQVEQATLYRLDTLERSTRTFEVDEEPELRLHLQEAVKLVSAGQPLLSECEPGDLKRVVAVIERVGRVAMHRVLGRQGIHPSPRPRAGRRPSRTLDDLQSLVQALETFEAAVPAIEALRPIQQRLSFHRRILRSVQDPVFVQLDSLQDILEAAAVPNVRLRELRLFAAWAMLYQRMSDGPPRSSNPDSDQLGQMWRTLCETTQSWLPSVLALWTTPPPAHHRRRVRDRFQVHAVRNWLQLWFAWQLFDPELVAPPPPGLGSAGWQLRGSVALLIRECLRHKLHGGEPGYVHRPEWTREALQPLVDYHVQAKFELDPEHDIRGHLALVGDPGHPRGAVFADGQLQHILDIYLVGHFMLSAHITGLTAQGERTEVIDLLASPEGHRAGALQRRNLLAAWSLAALYHNVGLTSFPEFRSHHDPGPVQAHAVADGIDLIHSALVEAGTKLASAARQALLAANIYEAQSSPELARWVDRQVNEGIPDPALTSAWYLLRAAQQVSDVHEKVVRAATRAVLLQGAPSASVNINQEPVPALLVMCDALFDWQPGGHSHGVRQDGQALRQSRIASIRFPDLDVTVVDGPVPSLRSTFAMTTDTVKLSPGSAPAWPRVVLTHVHPTRLGGHVFPLWISIAQNIARLRPSARGFGPLIEVRGQVPGRVHRTAESTTGLLDRVLPRIQSQWRARLKLWLTSTLSTPVSSLEAAADGGTPVESRLIYPLERSIARDDLRRHLPQLQQEADSVMLGWDNSGHPSWR